MDKSTKIGVLGGGIEGLEVIRYLHGHGYKNITLFDRNEALEIDLPVGVKKIKGENYLQEAQKCQIIFRSPGIHINALKPLQDAGISITGTISYFFENCSAKIIGITGTKGKGTTSTLVYLMLKEAGFDVHLGGNIGESPLTFLDQLKPESWVVLELSSFQLQDLKKSPHIAVVLGITPDHLDYHRDFDEYLEAKSAITKYQSAHDIAIFNRDYANSEYFAEITKADKFFVSAADKTFTGNGAHIADSKIVYCSGSKCELIGDIRKIALLGRHNLENVLPAVVTARQLNISIPIIQKVLYSFKGLPHRLEYVREIAGVQFYNDSLSTTPETSIAAVKAFNKPAILIAGGSDKGADYTNWAEEITKNGNLKAAVLIGQMAEKMQQVLQNAAKTGLSKKEKKDSIPEIIACNSFEEAVKTAYKKAYAGDVVLLSPAAASFDMFKSYKDRGERFVEIVKSLS